MPRSNSLFRGQRGTGTGWQRNCGCSIPGSVQSQVEWDFEKPGLMDPAHGGGFGTRWSLRALLAQSILWFFDSVCGKIHRDFSHQLLYDLNIFFKIEAWRSVTCCSVLMFIELLCSCTFMYRHFLPSGSWNWKHPLDTEQVFYVIVIML